ncbi:hypothetical protein ACI3LY_001090 [Candidozyma auris]|uniref:Uncharacterized protein n=2 Tax=Candidozyma auris TaxID=498019 RepID=A0A2H0ZJ25_CANAR|nr:hypothetical protein QG37_04419 [[Candida] auris]PIS50625.1 hypothetical protein B9J08_004453 [[Candida] auris]QWW25653.1 hypothetical protein CA7LBN_004540 [[Candida] auris]
MTVPFVSRLIINQGCLFRFIELDYNQLDLTVCRPYPPLDVRRFAAKPKGTSKSARPSKLVLSVFLRAIMKFPLEALREFFVAASLPPRRWREVPFLTKRGELRFCGYLPSGHAMVYNYDAACKLLEAGGNVSSNGNGNVESEVSAGPDLWPGEGTEVRDSEDMFPSFSNRYPSEPLTPLFSEFFDASSLHKPIFCGPAPPAWNIYPNESVQFGRVQNTFRLSSKILKDAKAIAETATETRRSHSKKQEVMEKSEEASNDALEAPRATVEPDISEEASGDILEVPGDTLEVPGDTLEPLGDVLEAFRALKKSGRLSKDALDVLTGLKDIVEEQRAKEAPMVAVGVGEEPEAPEASMLISKSKRKRQRKQRKQKAAVIKATTSESVLADAEVTRATNSSSLECAEQETTKALSRKVRSSSESSGETDYFEDASEPQTTLASPVLIEDVEKKLLQSTGHEDYVMAADGVDMTDEAVILL